MGGKTCSSTKARAGESGDSDSANPMANAAQAGKALGSLVGGLFKKKKSDDSADAGAAPGKGPTSAPDTKIPAQFAQDYTQMAAFTVETVSVTADSVAPGRFDVPADWTKETPKTAKDDEEYQCPKT